MNYKISTPVPIAQGLALFVLSEQQGEQEPLGMIRLMQGTDGMMRFYAHARREHDNKLGRFDEMIDALGAIINDAGTQKKPDLHLIN